METRLKGSRRMRNAHVFRFEQARIGGYKNHQYYNRLKTYETNET